MRTTIWLLLLALGLAACGGGATTSTSGNSVDAGGLELSGLSLDVHQAPD